MKAVKIVTLIFFFFFIFSEKAFSQEIMSPIEETSLPSPKKPGDRPSVALVLSGGGARGFAHLPVIELLEEEGIPLDIIIGNSAGSIAGALYCTGYDTKEIFYMMNEFALGEILNDNPPSPFELNLNRHSSYSHLIRAGGANTSGLSSGQKVYELFRKLTLRFSSQLNFDDLPIPFRAVTVNLFTGKVLVQDSGDLAEALRCSMSVPGMFEPFVKDGNYYIDGMARDDTPIDVALKMDYDIVIVSNLSDPLKSNPEDFDASVLETVIQMFNMEQYSRKENNEKLVDLSIYPDYAGESMISYSKGKEIYQASKKSMEKYREKVRKLKKDFFSSEYKVKKIKKYRDFPYKKVYSIKVSGDSKEDLTLVKKIASKYLKEDFTEKNYTQITNRLYETGLYKNIVIRLDNQGCLNFILTHQKKTYSQILFSPVINGTLSGHSQADILLSAEYQLHGLSGYGSILAFELTSLKDTGATILFRQPLNSIFFSQTELSIYDSFLKNNSVEKIQKASLVQNIGMNFPGIKAVLSLEAAGNYFNTKYSHDKDDSFYSAEGGINFKLNTLESFVFPSKGIMVDFTTKGIFPVSTEEREKILFSDRTEFSFTGATFINKNFSAAIDFSTGLNFSGNTASLQSLKAAYGFTYRNRLYFPNAYDTSFIKANMSALGLSFFYFPQTRLSMTGIKVMLGFSGASGIFWDEKKDLKSTDGIWRLSGDIGLQIRKNYAILLRIGAGSIDEELKPFISLDAGSFRQKSNALINY